MLEDASNSIETYLPCTLPLLTIATFVVLCNKGIVVLWVL